MMRLNCGTTSYPMCRIYCIGRNYADHVAELSNPIPEAPLVFMKPATALLGQGETIELPPGETEVHLETELVVLIGREGRYAAGEKLDRWIAGLALGLDLTLRDLQAVLKSKGHPWERAKGFDGSAPLGPLTPFDPEIHPLGNLRFQGYVNGECRQRGDTAEMLFPLPTLLENLSETWRLRPGDLVFTGTPAGVGPLVTGDRVEARSDCLQGASWRVA